MVNNDKLHDWLGLVLNAKRKYMLSTYFCSYDTNIQGKRQNTHTSKYD